MIWSILNRLFGGTVAEALRSRDPARWEDGLLNRVKEMTPTDPSAGAKVGGKEFADRLIAAMKTTRGVHVESLMCAAGAVAGYSCQVAIRTKNRDNGLPETIGFAVATTQDGDTFFFGDELNRLLAESQLSVWSIAAGAAQACGCHDIPDISGIFEHVAETIGSKEFGVPRLPDGHPIHELPRTYLDRFWPLFSASAARFCPNPDDWSLLFGLMLQNLLMQTKDALNSCIALKVIMESAIPMSKVNRSGPE